MSIPQQIHEQNKNSRVVMAIFDEENNNWYFTYTVYAGDDEIHTITCVNPSLMLACKQAEQANCRVDSEWASGKLLLPSMGDWSVSYKKP
jgi:hypothetical protein